MAERTGADQSGTADEGNMSVREAGRKGGKTTRARYGAEFFAGLYGGRKARRRHKAFAAALSDLQDHLGGLNDLATAHAVMAGLADASGVGPVPPGLLPHGRPPVDADDDRGDGKNVTLDASVRAKRHLAATP